MPDIVTENVQMYLDYLDKEMTIMGVLSTFCIAVVALVIDKLNSADKTGWYAALAAEHPVQIYLGCALLIAAGLCFYLQRSKLAHYYSSICISIVNPDVTEWDTKRWLTEVYTYYAWMRYRNGFQILAIVPIIFGHAVYQVIYKGWYPCWKTEIAIIVMIELLMTIHNFVYYIYRYETHPWRHFSLKTIRQDFTMRGVPPNLRKPPSEVDTQHWT